MEIVGGFYSERCIVPEWDVAFGSGGRAAAAVSSLSKGVTLHTYCARDLAADARSIAATFGVRPHLSMSPYDVAFFYFHPLSDPQIFPEIASITPLSAIKVQGHTVLRFGMLEGSAIVSADRAVYDPQSNLRPESFRHNGSSAKHLAIVLNQNELRVLSAEPDWRAAVESLAQKENAEVVIVKRGAYGAFVWGRSGQTSSVPAYRSESVFKIGSGDVFSAAFSLFWGEHGMDAVAAADLASRASAWYCGNRTLPLPPLEELRKLVPAKMGKPGRIYLASPFFSLGQRWVVEQARNSLLQLGTEVFSPVHDVGFGSPAEVARADLNGLDSCSAVLAVVDGSDPGTAFEVGYARARDIPVVVLGESVHSRDLTMAAGTSCEITSDFGSAIYRSIWASIT